MKSNHSGKKENKVQNKTCRIKLKTERSISSKREEKLNQRGGLPPEQWCLETSRTTMIYYITDIINVCCVSRSFGHLGYKRELLTNSTQLTLIVGINNEGHLRWLIKSAENTS